MPLHPERSASPVRTQLPRPSRQRRAGHRTSNHNLEATLHLERTRELHERGRQSVAEQKRRQHPALSNACVFTRLRQECTQSQLLGLRVTEEMGNESPQLPCDSCLVEENQSRVQSRPVKRLLDVLETTHMWVEHRVCKTSTKEPTMASAHHLNGTHQHVPSHQRLAEHTPYRIALNGV